MQYEFRYARLIWPFLQHLTLDLGRLVCWEVVHFELLKQTPNRVHGLTHHTKSELQIERLPHQHLKLVWEFRIRLSKKVLRSESGNAFAIALKQCAFIEVTLPSNSSIQCQAAWATRQSISVIKRSIASDGEDSL
jgi:hypothetical protein